MFFHGKLVGSSSLLNKIDYIILQRVEYILIMELQTKKRMKMIVSLIVLYFNDRNFNRKCRLLYYVDCYGRSASLMIARVSSLY